MSIEQRLREAIDEHIGDPRPDDDAWGGIRRRIEGGVAPEPKTHRERRQRVFAAAVAVVVFGAVAIGLGLSIRQGRSPSNPGSVTPPADVIVLSPLPAEGIAAMWSKNDRNGVSFVWLDGTVAATISDATIYKPGGRPGTVVLLRGKDEYLLLDPVAHVLRKISKSHADHLTRLVPWPATPHGAPGIWWWVAQSPDGGGKLGQSYQHNSECSVPIAMLQSSSAPSFEPITGQSLQTAQPSTALGWTSSNQAIAAVGLEACGQGQHRFAEGVYLFDAVGHPTASVKMPAGSYSFQMWSAP